MTATFARRRGPAGVLDALAAGPDRPRATGSLWTPNGHRPQMARHLRAGFGIDDQRAQDFEKATAELAAAWARTDTASPVRANTGDALTASAEILGVDRASIVQSRRQPWQIEAYGYAESLGEAAYINRFLGWCFSKVKLRLGWRDDDEEVSKLPKDDELPAEVKALLPTAVALIRSLKARRGGQANLMRRLGGNLGIGAEAFLLPTDGMVDMRGNAWNRRWDVLSVEELRPMVDGGGYTRIMGPGLAPVILPADTYVIRIWEDDYRYSFQAAGQMRAVLEICEELKLLTREVRAHALSRLASAGILLYNKDIDFADDPTSEGSESEDPFGDLFLDAAVAAIQDKGAASSHVPLAIGISGVDSLGGFKNVMEHLSFAPEQETASIAKRTEAVQRLAQGVDLPPEIVTGMHASTFNNAQQISEDLYNQHISGKVGVCTDGLTDGYFLPFLAVAAGIIGDVRDFGTVVLPEWLERLAIYGDASSLVAPPDRSKEAEAGHRDFVISNDARRRYSGFTEEDAPTPEEIEERISWEQRRNSRETLRAEDQTTGVSLIENPSDPAKIDEGGKAAPLPAEHPQGPAAAAALILADRMAVAADMAVERAADKAGAKLRSKLSGRREAAGLRGQIDGCRADDRLCSVLGRNITVNTVPVDELLAGEFKAFARVAARLAADGGHVDPQAAAMRVCAVVEATSRERLFDVTVRVDRVRVAEALG